MNDWLRNNVWSLLAAGAVLVSFYALTNYRIGQLEAQVTKTQQTINTSEMVQIQIQLSLRAMEVDLDHIKKAIDRLGI